MICSSVNLVRFIVRPQVGPDSNRIWRKNPGAGHGRAGAFDNLIAAIGAALETDRTLGGLCDWVEPEAPASVDLPVEGAATLKAAVIIVVLHYTTTGPLA